MATRVPAKAPANAVVAVPLSNDDLMALLREGGFVGSASNEYHRITLSNGRLFTDKGTDHEEMFPPSKTGLTMRVRIVKPPVYYNAFYLSTKNENNDKNTFNAESIGFPEFNGRFCKKYDDPAEQEADGNQANSIFEDVARATGRRGAFKADVLLQIVPESGELTGEETVYTLSLSTTSALDWRGTSKSPSAGIVQDKNFIVQLAEFAMATAQEAGASDIDQKTAVMRAMGALSIGDVIADIYLLDAQNDDASNTWTVVAFRPVYIADSESLPALGSGNDEDLPF